MAAPLSTQGVFISVEGPEGSGKSTQVERLRAVLASRGRDVLVTREPGGTVLGERLRDLIMHFHAPEGVCPEAEVLMFGASRAQLVRRLIRPHLTAGGVVICDRFADSTTVYQGRVRGLDPGFIQAMHRLTIGDCWPDVTLLLDLDVHTGLARTRQRPNQARDRIEEEPRQFHEAVRQGFLQLSREQPERIRVIDAGAPQDVVHQHILEALHDAIG